MSCNRIYSLLNVSTHVTNGNLVFAFCVSRFFKKNLLLVYFYEINLDFLSNYAKNTFFYVIIKFWCIYDGRFIEKDDTLDVDI